MTVCYPGTNKSLPADCLEKYHELRKSKNEIIQNKTIWNQYELPKALKKIFPNIRSSTASSENNKERKTKKFKIKFKKQVPVIPATEEMLEYLAKYSTETVLIKCLISTQWNVKKALERLLKQVQFRCIYDIDNITPEKCEQGLKLNMFYSLNKVTKQGAPINYVIFPEKIGKTEDDYKIFLALIWTYEKNLKIATENGTHTTLSIYDLSKVKISKLPPVKFIKDLVEFTNTLYPESVYKLFMLFAPKSFKVGFKMVAPLLSQAQKQKIHVRNKKQSNDLKIFDDIIDKDNVPIKYGGSDSLEYSYKWEVEQYNNQTLKNTDEK